MRNKRPFGLVAIVVYKAFVALLLAITAIILLLALKNYQNLVAFSESYVLEGKLAIIELLLDKVINVKKSTLGLSGIAAGVYAVVTAIEAVGLWYQKAWAEILVIGLVSISIPPEIFELSRGITLLKLLVFLVNIAVLWYLLKLFLKHRR